MDKQDLDDDFYNTLKEKLLSEFENNFSLHTNNESIRYKKYHAEKLLRLKIINAARSSIYQLAKERKISDELARDLVAKLDLDEIRFS